MDIFLFINRERPHIFFSKDLILELKLCLIWHNPLTPVRQEVSKAYFPEWIAVLDPKESSQKNGVLKAEYLMAISLKTVLLFNPSQQN